MCKYKRRKPEKIYIRSELDSAIALHLYLFSLKYITVFYKFLDGVTKPR